MPKRLFNNHYFHRMIGDFIVYNFGIDFNTFQEKQLLIFCEYRFPSFLHVIDIFLA